MQMRSVTRTDNIEEAELCRCTQSQGQTILRKWYCVDALSHTDRQCRGSGTAQMHSITRANDKEIGQCDYKLCRLTQVHFLLHIFYSLCYLQCLSGLVSDLCAETELAGLRGAGRVPTQR